MQSLEHTKEETEESEHTCTRKSTTGMSFADFMSGGKANNVYIHRDMIKVQESCDRFPSCNFRILEDVSRLVGITKVVFFQRVDQELHGSSNHF